MAGNSVPLQNVWKKTGHSATKPPDTKPVKVDDDDVGKSCNRHHIHVVYSFLTLKCILKLLFVLVYMVSSIFTPYSSKNDIVLIIPPVTVIAVCYY